MLYEMLTSLHNGEKNRNRYARRASTMISQMSTMLDKNAEDADIHEANDPWNPYVDPQYALPTLEQLRILRDADVPRLFG